VPTVCLYTDVTDVSEANPVKRNLIGPIGLTRVDAAAYTAYLSMAGLLCSLLLLLQQLQPAATTGEVADADDVRLALFSSSIQCHKRYFSLKTKNRTFYAVVNHSFT